MMMGDVEGGENPGRASKTPGSTHTHTEKKKIGPTLLSSKNCCQRLKKMSLETIKF